MSDQPPQYPPTGGQPPHYPPPNVPPPGQPGPGPGGLGQPGMPPPPPLAPWIHRVGGYVLDSLILLPPYVLVAIGGAMQDESGEVTTVSVVGIVIGLVGLVLTIGLAIWNVLIRQGRTGWSVGKQVIGIRLIGEYTGQPIGAGRAFLRQLAHFLDSLACYIGWLWPLWDHKKQTFADKIMSTVVIQQPKPKETPTAGFSAG